MINGRSIVFSLLLIGAPVKLFSQELNVVLDPGLGSFKMSDLKELNDVDLKSLPFEAKVTENFPLYWNFKPSLLFSFRKLLSIGITWTYQSTGARVSREDYSGEYSFDTKIRASSPGIIAALYFPISKFNIAFSHEVGIEYTKLSLKEHLRVNTETQENEFAFTSKNYYYEPSVKISYPISFFRLGIFAGYLIDFKQGDFSSADGKNITLYLSEKKRPTANWKGIRFGCSLSFNLFRRFK